ncbi:hypothetical protein [Nocardia sp. CA-120079]
MAILMIVLRSAQPTHQLGGVIIGFGPWLPSLTKNAAYWPR